jgi:hypothetical protein
VVVAAAAAALAFSPRLRRSVRDLADKALRQAEGRESATPKLARRSASTADDTSNSPI